METEVQPLRVGTRVKIKPIHLSQHDDWKAHKDDIGLVRDNDGSSSYNLFIRWPDGDESCASERHIDIVSEDWDE